MKDILKKCGGCGSEDKKSIKLVYDKKKNRGYLCQACQQEYGHLLLATSTRRFWMCEACRFRILAGTRIDAAVDPESKCPYCGEDVNFTLINLSNDKPVQTDIFGSPID